MKYGIRYNLLGWWVYEVATGLNVRGPFHYKWVAQGKADLFNQEVL